MSFHRIIADYVQKQLPVYQKIALDIHEHPETSNHEYFACKTLSEQLRREGFSIQVDVAGHPTGFSAVYKAKKSGPVLVFLAEYDALAGLGHGCGHNLFGATSSLAAAALKQVIDEVGGELRVYGTPGEEGGENGSAKGSFVREGFFRDVDAALCVHPSTSTHRPTIKTLACAPVDIEFWGRAAHAASAPFKGINALDALIQVYNSINALRQQLTSDVRIHGIITKGGDAPNIIPQYAAAKFYLRAAAAPTLQEVYQKVDNIVQGAALATGCRGRMQPYQNRVENTVVTPKFDAVYEKHLEEFGEHFDKSSQRTLGSSDVGNVSQVIPTIQPLIQITNTPVDGHSEGMVKACAAQQGLDSIGLGANVLARTALDLILDPQLLADIKAEHARNVKHQVEDAAQ